MTLDYKEINNFAQTIATSHWGPNVVGASSAPFTDLDGNPAVQITIFFKAEFPRTLMPKTAASSTITEIRERFLKAGDERFPFVQFSTRGLTAGSGDGL
jgi:hypothetical protein